MMQKGSIRLSGRGFGRSGSQARLAPTTRRIVVLGGDGREVSGGHVDLFDVFFLVALLSTLSISIVHIC